MTDHQNSPLTDDLPENEHSTCPLYCCDCGDKLESGADCDMPGCFAGEKCTLDELKAQLSKDERDLLGKVVRDVERCRDDHAWPSGYLSAYRHGLVMGLIMFGPSVSGQLLSCIHAEVGSVIGGAA